MKFSNSDSILDYFRIIFFFFDKFFDKFRFETRSVQALDVTVGRCGDTLGGWQTNEQISIRLSWASY